jgi:hypothetical protein
MYKLYVYLCTPCSPDDMPPKPASDTKRKRTLLADIYNRVPQHLGTRAQFRCFRLTPSNPGWKITKPINVSDPAYVWSVNQWLEKRRVSSHVREGTDEVVECPHGLTLLERLPVGDLCERARAELLDLYESERKTPSKIHTTQGVRNISANNGTTLFYDGETPILLSDIVAWLVERRYFALVTFTMVHLKAVLYVIGRNTDAIFQCKMNLVRYAAGEGLKAHMDGVKNTKLRFSPVATIGLDTDSKCLDLFPTLVPGCEPVRAMSEPYQTTIMQGPVRERYAHCVPEGQSTERLTMIFVFT